jgi:hypothetical protein
LKNFCTVKLARRVVARQGAYYRPLTCVDDQNTRPGELVCAAASCADLAVINFSKKLITPHLPTLSPRVFNLPFSQTNTFHLFSPQTQTLSNFFTPLKIKLILAFIFALFQHQFNRFDFFSYILVFNFVNLGFEIVK